MQAVSYKHEGKPMLNMLTEISKQYEYNTADHLHNGDDAESKGG